jgi:hypothetical protein
MVAAVRTARPRLAAPITGTVLATRGCGYPPYTGELFLVLGWARFAGFRFLVSLRASAGGCFLCSGSLLFGAGVGLASEDPFAAVGDGDDHGLAESEGGGGGGHDDHEGDGDEDGQGGAAGGLLLVEGVDGDDLVPGAEEQDGEGCR